MSKGERSIGGERLIHVLREFATSTRFSPGCIVGVERAEGSGHVEVFVRRRNAETRTTRIASLMVSDPFEAEAGDHRETARDVLFDLVREFAENVADADRGPHDR